MIYVNYQILILFKMTQVFEGRIPLSRIHQGQDLSVNIKRSILISHQKLPKDFFPSRNSLRSEMTEQKGRANLFSQGIKRNFSQIQESQVIPKRESMTAREVRVDKQQDLIMGIISASRQMKRVMRKHSMELKKKENQFSQIKINTNRRVERHRGIQLPPLLMKKGATLAF